MDNKENETTENGTIIFIHPEFENQLFDVLYDRFITITDTDQLIENISTETLESFWYQTAKFFYGYKMKKGMYAK